jgi:cell division protein FtsN
MSVPQPSRNDPTPQERKGDSRFLPVVVAAAIAVIVILLAALIFLKVRKTGAIPKANDAGPTSQIVQPRLQPSLQISIGNGCETRTQQNIYPLYS